MSLKVIATDSIFVRLPSPLKKRSSTSLLRIDLKLCSPKTKRIASVILDLPDPLGPTMPVIAELKINSVFLPKDLNPEIFKECIFMQNYTEKYSTKYLFFGSVVL